RSRVVHVHTRLGQFDEALATLDAVESGGQALLLRRIIERRRQLGADAEEVMDLLTRFTEVAQADATTERRRSNLIWAAALRGRLLLLAGDPIRASDHIAFRYARFAEESGDADLGSLAVVM